MSPEQAAGSVVGPASDWYAVGAMLYRTLTGTVPFVGSPIDVLREKQRQEPIRPLQRQTMCRPQCVGGQSGAKWVDKVQ